MFCLAFAYHFNVHFFLHQSFRKTLSRCALASDTLNTIRKCLAYFPEWTHSSTNVSSLASLCLRSSIRQSLSSHIILEFVKLGYLLEDKFIFPRLVHVMDHSANSEQKGLVSESAAFDSSIIFEVWERRLW